MSRDAEQTPKVAIIGDMRRNRSSATKHSIRENMFHQLERTLDLAANNLDGFQMALKEAKRIAQIIKEQT